MKIAGVSLGTSFDAVKASLGQPTSEKRDELTYGGIKFGHSLMQDSRPIVWYITVSNRDAVTARGIAVGDTLKRLWTFMDALILSTLITVGSMDISDIIAITFAVYSLNIMAAR